MFNLDQSLWDTHARLLFIHFVVTCGCIFYFLVAEKEHFKTLKFHQKVLELIRWATIIPFSVSLFFGFILFGGVGLLWLYSVTG